MSKETELKTAVNNASAAQVILQGVYDTLAALSVDDHQAYLSDYQLGTLKETFDALLPLVFRTLAQLEGIENTREVV